MRAINHLKQYRQLFLKVTSDLSPEQMLEIPPERSNNILWNVGHVMVTQQLLHYALSGNPMLVPDATVAVLRKGTSPADWDTPPEFAEIRRLLVELPEKLETDHAAGLFQEYRPYSTSAGVDLNSIEDSLEFNNFHEGLHLGVILSIRKSIGA